MAYERPLAKALSRRLREPRRFHQVVAGPRQVGKTTLVESVLARARRPFQSVSADEPTLRSTSWIEQHWQAARVMARDAGAAGALLAIDEVQKIPGWSNVIKRLWDEDSRTKCNLKYYSARRRC